MIPPILSALLYCNSPVLFTQRLLIKSPQVKFIPLQKTNVGVFIFKVSFSNGRKGFLSTLKEETRGGKRVSGECVAATGTRAAAPGPSPRVLSYILLLKIPLNANSDVLSHFWHPPRHSPSLQPRRHPMACPGSCFRRC